MYRTMPPKVKKTVVSTVPASRFKSKQAKTVSASGSKPNQQKTAYGVKSQSNVVGSKKRARPAATKARPGYTLYGTDSEEQIGEVDKGLTRCANIVRQMLDVRKGRNTRPNSEPPSGTREVTSAGKTSPRQTNRTPVVIPTAPADQTTTSPYVTPGSKSLPPNHPTPFNTRLATSTPDPEKMDSFAVSTEKVPQYFRKQPAQNVNDGCSFERPVTASGTTQAHFLQQILDADEKTNKPNQNFHPPVGVPQGAVLSPELLEQYSSNVPTVNTSQRLQMLQNLNTANSAPFHPQQCPPEQYYTTAAPPGGNTSVQVYPEGILRVAHQCLPHPRKPGSETAEIPFIDNTLDVSEYQQLPSPQSLFQGYKGNQTESGALVQNALSNVPLEARESAGFIPVVNNDIQRTNTSSLQTSARNATYSNEIPVRDSNPSTPDKSSQSHLTSASSQRPGNISDSTYTLNSVNHVPVTQIQNEFRKLLIQPVNQPPTQVRGPVNQAQTQFQGPVNQPQTQFQGPVYQPQTQFQGPVNQPQTQFQGPVNQPQTQFQGPVNQPQTQFQGPVNQAQTQFQGPVNQNHMQFTEPWSQTVDGLRGPVNQTQMEFRRQENQVQNEFSGPVNQNEIKRPRNPNLFEVRGLINQQNVNGGGPINQKQTELNAPLNQQQSEFRGPVNQNEFRGPVNQNEFRGPVNQNEFRGPADQNEFSGPENLSAFGSHPANQTVSSVRGPNQTGDPTNQMINSVRGPSRQTGDPTYQTVNGAVNGSNSAVQANNNVWGPANHAVNRGPSIQASNNEWGSVNPATNIVWGPTNQCLNNEWGPINQLSHRSSDTCPTERDNSIQSQVYSKSVFSDPSVDIRAEIEKAMQPLLDENKQLRSNLRSVSQQLKDLQRDWTTQKDKEKEIDKKFTFENEEQAEKPFELQSSDLKDIHSLEISLEEEKTRGDNLQSQLNLCQRELQQYKNDRIKLLQALESKDSEKLSLRLSHQQELSRLNTELQIQQKQGESYRLKLDASEKESHILAITLKQRDSEIDRLQELVLTMKHSMSEIIKDQQSNPQENTQLGASFNLQRLERLLREGNPSSVVPDFLDNFKHFNGEDDRGGNSAKVTPPLTVNALERHNNFGFSDQRDGQDQQNSEDIWNDEVGSVQSNLSTISTVDTNTTLTSDHDVSSVSTVLNQNENEAHSSKPSDKKKSVHFEISSVESVVDSNSNDDVLSVVSDEHSRYSVTDYFKKYPVNGDEENRIVTGEKFANDKPVSSRLSPGSAEASGSNQSQKGGNSGRKSSSSDGKKAPPRPPPPLRNPLNFDDTESQTTASAITFSSVSTLATVDESVFREGLANLDANIARLQESLQKKKALLSS